MICCCCLAPSSTCCVSLCFQVWISRLLHLLHFLPDAVPACRAPFVPSAAPVTEAPQHTLPQYACHPHCSPVHGYSVPPSTMSGLAVHGTSVMLLLQLLQRACMTAARCLSFKKQSMVVVGAGVGALMTHHDAEQKQTCNMQML